MKPAPTIDEVLTLIGDKKAVLLQWREGTSSLIRCYIPTIEGVFYESCELKNDPLLEEYNLRVEGYARERIYNAVAHSRNLPLWRNYPPTEQEIAEAIAKFKGFSVHKEQE